MDKLGKGALAVVGLVLLAVAVVALFHVVAPVVGSWAWAAGFGSVLACVKVVVDVVVGAVGVALVRASR